MLVYSPGCFPELPTGSTGCVYYAVEGYVEQEVGAGVNDGGESDGCFQDCWGEHSNAVFVGAREDGAFNCDGVGVGDFLGWGGSGAMQAVGDAD